MMNGTGTSSQLGCRSVAMGCKERREMPAHTHVVRLAEVFRGHWPAVTRQFTSREGSRWLQRYRWHPALHTISTTPGVPHVTGSEEHRRQCEGK